MRIYITTKPKSKKRRVEQLDKENYVVYVKESPIEGRANNAVIETLAEYFQIPPSKLEVVTGHNGRRKIIELYLDLEPRE